MFTYFDSEALLENGFLGMANCCISSPPPFTDALLDAPEVDGLLDVPEVDGLLDVPEVDNLLVDDIVSGVESNEDFEEDFLVSLDPIALALPLVTLTKVTPSLTSR